MIAARVAVAVLVVGVLAVIGCAKVQSGRGVTLPAPSGPNPVGRAIYDWTDHSRTDPHPPAPGSCRCKLWYPATPIPGAAATSYLPPGWDQALNSGGGIGAGSTSPTPHRATSTRTR